MKLDEQALIFIRKVISGKYGKNVAAAAEGLGVPYRTLYSWLNGSRTPNFKILAPILEKLNVSFAFPDEPLLQYQLPEQCLPLVKSGTDLELRDRHEGFFGFRRDWMEFENISRESSVLIEMPDDSMQPAIGKDDTLLVDLSDTEFLWSGKPYLIATADEAMVRYVHKQPAGVLIHAMNSTMHPDYLVPNEDIGKTVKICGRVRWAGKKL